MTAKAIHASKIKKEQTKLSQEMADADLKAANALAGYFQKLDQQGQKTVTQQDASVLNQIKMAQETRTLAETQAQQNNALAVATGHMTQQQAAARMLTLLEKDKKQALGDINAVLDTQLQKLRQLSDATMGGLVGAEEQKAAFAQAAEQYRKLKNEQLQIEKEYATKIAAERKTQSNSELTQWRKQFLDWQQVQKQTSQIGMQTLSGLNSNLAQFVTTGKANWSGLAQSAISSFIEMGLHYAESKAGMALIDAIWGSQKEANDTAALTSTLAKNAAIAQSSAATAAANTLADVPYPLNIPASAEVFATGEMYAADAMAERGALLPNRDMMVHTHPEEMILPRNISNFIVKAAGGNQQNDAAPSFSYNPTINAGFATGKELIVT